MPLVREALYEQSGKWSQQSGGSDCLPKTQASAKSKDDV